MRSPADGVSVLRLALDTHDPVHRARVEAMFGAAYQLRRALQRDARDRSRAYWAAAHERSHDPAAVRERLGLTRTALDHTAYAHLDGAPHLRRFATKALAMHLADSVWTATERHLFRDARGGRHGMPHIGRWLDFTRLPGRARSHTRANKWETFRLHGTLAGHRARFTRSAGDFVQPHRLPAITSDAWWTYTGPLAVVFTGLPGGALVLPVRLPTAPCNQPILEHHLADHRVVPAMGRGRRGVLTGRVGHGDRSRGPRGRRARRGAGRPAARVDAPDRDVATLSLRSARRQAAR